MAYDAGVPKDLINFIRDTLKQELRQCYPRDIVNQVLWAARYEGKKPHMDHAAMAQAVEAYFSDAELKISRWTAHFVSVSNLCFFPPSRFLARMPLSTSARISRAAVSCEHF